MMRCFGFICATIWLASLADGTQEFTAHRMLQYDDASKPHGARRTYVSSLAGTMASAELSGKMAMIQMHELNLAVVKSIADGTIARAVLIILPHNLAELPPEAKANWQALEHEMLRAEIPIPVYFTFSSSEVDGIYSSVATESGTSDAYQLQVSGGEASAVSPLRATNLQGWLQGAADRGPILAIVAHYDTFAVAPSLAHGADDNASGVVALLELARLFSKLYSRHRTQGEYNLLFVLTGAGRVNFAGTKHWLEQADVQLLENIEFALCIDAIGQGDGLHFHLSKPAKDTEIVALYNEFKRSASEMGIGFNVSHRKIDLSDPEVYWQHEQFSRKRVLGATISHKPTAASTIGRGSILDTKVDIRVLVRNIRFIAEVVARHVYKLHGASLQIFKESLALDQKFIAAWHSAVTEESRMQVAMMGGRKEGPSSPKLLEGLERCLNKYIKSVKSEVFSVSTPFTFYDTFKVQIYAYRVKPPTFDLIFSGAIIVYFIVLFIGLAGFENAKNHICSLFRPSKKKLR